MPSASPPDAASSPSLDQAEVEKFSAMADEWWDPLGKFKPLHVFNPTRLAFIRDTVTTQRGLDPKAQTPFAGLRLLDIGCGGGLVSEPMARLGAEVTGVDASHANIAVAQVHAERSQLAIDYRHGTAEQLLEAGEPAFDVVLNLEVVEHVADVSGYLRTCAQLVAPGGVMILATINRTPKAFALAIVGAEYVLRWLPRGTHQYAKLVRPSEARRPLEAEGLTVEGPVGVSYNPLAASWSLSRDASVNYMLTAIRAPAQ